MHPLEKKAQSPRDAEGTIELRLSTLAQLFQLDPPPLREGTLTADAENFILMKAEQIPSHQPIRFMVDLPPDAAERNLDIGSVMSAHFAERATVQSKEILELFRNGRKALVIGLVTLALCLLLAWHFSYNAPQRPITRLLQESFVILGWVSMWKPIEIFLYEWLPFARRRKLFTRLSEAAVTVKSKERG